MIRIGIVDSGIDGPARAQVAACADFPAGVPLIEPATEDAREARDRHGHGSRVAELIATGAAFELLDARVFFDTLITSAAQAAAAIDWLLGRQARMINLSFGLRDDREVLRAACARAVAAGVLVVAASPARGDPVFPAAYTGVVRATGDARCAPGEISCLDTAQADFGGEVRSPDGVLAGASAGCASVCAALAALLAATPCIDNAEALARLQQGARYRGAERRGARP